MADVERDLAIRLTLADESATIALGEDLALALKAGDCLALHGDLGAGKSTLSRAFIRALADMPELDVPSPTFTLVQSYETTPPIAHFDLYRLGSSDELDELGLDEALETGICLIEWPERAEDRLPKACLHLTYAFNKQGGREVEFTGPAPLLNRIKRVLAIRVFLDTNGYPGAKRRFLSGDADYRAYETIEAEGQTPRILMDSPKRPPTPIIRHGKTYPELVHLAEDCHAFVAIDQLLHSMGAVVPKIYASDLEQGLLLIEDLGNQGVLDDAGQPIAERYRATVSVLASLHGQNVSREIMVTPAHTHIIPEFDSAAMLFETELLLDWYLPWKLGRAASDAERQDFQSLWHDLVSRIHDRTSLVLRDVHSPNLLWQANRSGTERVGLIDFQDAMIGPAAYDMASLVQDARVTIAPDLQQLMLDDYLALRQLEAGFDPAAFLEDFAIMSAQRNCKLLGLWVRLLQRDGKPGYMQHMPRTLTYLASAFGHAALAPLQQWFANTKLLDDA